jgi:alpha-tubulin suppressor-like RCC1 family protein
VIDDGTVRCWGANDDGQLGDGTPGEPCTSIGRAHTCRATPVAVKINSVQQLATGRLHTCAVRRDGSVACWGYRGSIGSAPRAVPEPVAGLSGIVEVAAGFTLTCARADDGRVSCWGLSPTESGPWKPLATPTRIPGIEGKAVRLAAYESDYCVVVERGAPWCWGDNSEAQLGVSTDNVIEEPMRLPL